MKAGIYLSAALMLLLPSGCIPSEHTGEVGVNISFAPSALTKGRIDPGDDQVGFMSIFVYKDGRLYQDIRTPGVEADLVLEEGKTYGIYALANIETVSPPVFESDLDTLRFRMDAIDDLADGLPMAFFGPGALTAREGMHVKYNLTRLVSKWTLSMDLSKLHSVFIIESVRLRQAALDVTPFAPGSKAQRVGDGDWSEGLMNLTGKTVTLYALENARGELLPANDNPFLKTREELRKVSPESDLCTYLEIRARWSLNGVSGIFNMRTYLGENLCSDFSVMRNTAYSLRVSFSDGAPVENSWRMELEKLSDTREFDLPDGPLDCPQGSGWHDVPLSVNFYNQEVYVEPLDEAKFDKYKVDFLRDADVLRFRSRYVGPDTTSFRFDVYTWDRLVRGRIVYRLTHSESDYQGYEDNTSIFHYQEGSLVFPSQDDVSLILPNGSSVNFRSVGMDRSAMDSGVICITNKAEHLIRTRVLTRTGHTTATLVCGDRSSTVKIGPNLFPRLKYEKPYLKLEDQMGRELDVRTFQNNGLNYGQKVRCEDLPARTTYEVSQPESELLQHNSVAKIVFTSNGTVSATPVKIISTVMDYDLSVTSSLIF